MYCCLFAAAAPPDLVEAVARACSPRVELHGTEAALLDVDGLTRSWGPPETIARDVLELATAQGLAARVALARTKTTVWLLAHARPGATVVAPGAEAGALAPLPVGWLATLVDLDRTPSCSDDYREHFATFARWGLRTLGDIAALPRGDIHARMGGAGVRLHQAALGEDITPLVPVAEAAPFIDRQALEWPIEGLEPLSFVLARQCERLSIALERADRGAVTVTTRLALVTRETHERVLHLPSPMRDARVLRTLVLLDLESHPPSAGVDAVEIALEVTPGRIVQGSLLSRSLPTQEDLATLVARLGALMGESRVGAPVLLDTHDDRQAAIVPFRLPAETPIARRRGVSASTPPSRPSSAGAPAPAPAPARPVEAAGEWTPAVPRAALRRFRLPIPARVTLDRGTPVRVSPSARALRGGEVVACAGPWRTSGAWWTLDGTAWDRDLWDVELADGGVYRLAHDRAQRGWSIEGLFD
jgi:protein ImuB